MCKRRRRSREKAQREHTSVFFRCRRSRMVPRIHANLLRTRMRDSAATGVPEGEDWRMPLRGSHGAGAPTPPSPAECSFLELGRTHSLSAPTPLTLSISFYVVLPCATDSIARLALSLKLAPPPPTHTQICCLPPLQTRSVASAPPSALPHHPRPRVLSAVTPSHRLFLAPSLSLSVS